MKKIFAILLIVLAFSILLNVYLLNYNSEDAKGIYLILEIFANGKLILRKENDIFKYNFANLTKLFFANLHNLKSEKITWYYTYHFIYDNWNDVINDKFSDYSTCGLVKSTINTDIDFQGLKLGFVFYNNQYLGIWKKTFDIGFGDNITQFINVYGEFPSLKHSTNYTNFYYKNGNYTVRKCAESSHYFIDYNIGITTYQEALNNQIRIYYIGYWKNPYDNFNIQYSRLYIPILYTYEAKINPKTIFPYFRDYVLIAEELFNITVYKGDFLKFQYVLVINQ
jgi:hypothetical protein